MFWVWFWRQEPGMGRFLGVAVSCSWVVVVGFVVEIQGCAALQDWASSGVIVSESLHSPASLYSQL